MGQLPLTSSAGGGWRCSGSALHSASVPSMAPITAFSGPTKKIMGFITVNNLIHRKMQLLVVLKKEILLLTTSIAAQHYKAPLAPYLQQLFASAPCWAFIASLVIYESQCHSFSFLKNTSRHITSQSCNAWDQRPPSHIHIQLCSMTRLPSHSSSPCLLNCFPLMKNLSSHL